MKAIQFLLEVWGTQARQAGEYFCLATKNKRGKWKDHFFKWPVGYRDLRDFFGRYSTDDYNLYFCPHGFSEESRLKKYATGTKFLWADLDEKDPAQCKPVPQVAWQSSPGRYAALWRLQRYEDSREKVEGINQALTYANGADRGGWDFSQVLRIPGTRNHKYKGSPEGKMLWMKDNAYGLDAFPDPDEVVTSASNPVEVLSKVKKKIKPSTLRLLTSKKATVGKRSEVIWKLENELHEQGLNADQIFILIKHSVWNKFAGRRDEDGQLKRELSKVHGRKDRPSIAGLDDEEKSTTKTGLIRMHDVEPEDVSWLWYPYIAEGKLTLMEGDPGLGKSWLTMALSSHVSKGLTLPEQEIMRGGTVLIMSAEDGLGDTLRPRLDLLNASTENIYAIEDPVRFDEDGVEEIEGYIQEIKPKLVIVDPLVAYMGGDVDLHKANETREVMARMGRLAEKHHLAIVAVRHLTKGGRDKSIYRGIGSIDLTAAARSVLMIGRNPDDPNEGRVICHIKSNLAPLGRPIGYSLTRKSKKPFRWDGIVDYTPEEIMKAEPTSDKGEFELALEFLAEQLKDKKPVSGDKLKRDAEAKGIHSKTLIAARKQLGVSVAKGASGFLWSL